jgi:NAD(P)H-hydrate repair Nnr-like enzyme with NAD(P)H-hydrate epimerase domain
MNRQNVLATAAAENGITENPPYSSKTKYGAWYGLDGVRWCAIFVSWVFDKAGLPLGKIDSAKGYHYCPSAYNYWRRNNQLTNAPQPGDIVLFDWDGDGWSDHTGIFNQWIKQGETFTAWEGNTSPTNNSNGGQVLLRTRSVGVVKAFVNPGVYGDQMQPFQNVLKKGSTGSETTRIQKMLYDLDYTIIVDGVFGTATEKVVKKFQQEHLLDVTGIVDEITKGALQAELTWKNETSIASGSILKKGHSGAAVVTLQKALNKKGAKLVADGVFGEATLKALKTFQKKAKMKEDGIAGSQVWKALNTR